MKIKLIADKFQENKSLIDQYTSFLNWQNNNLGLFKLLSSHKVNKREVIDSTT